MSTGKGTKRAATASMAGTSAAARAQTFSIEYAKSSLSTCSECQLKIPRNEIRVKITVPDPQQLQDGGQVIFFHVECFAASRNKLDWMDSADLLPGFSELYAHDQATVMIQLPAIKKDADVPDRKRAKKVAKVGDGAQKLDKIIAKQNKEFTKIRNELKAHTNQGDWVYILQRNSQAVPTKKSEILDHTADILTFGAIAVCRECNNGRFVLSNSAYVCNGDLNGQAKCGKVVKSPDRIVVQIPASMKADYAFLYAKFEVQTRAFPVLNDESNKLNRSQSKPTRIVLKLKNGQAVDPESGLGEIAHVYSDDKLVYSTILSTVDIEKNKNRRYKIQLLESDSQTNRKYWLFRSWGRVAMTMGSSKTEECNGLEEARNRFFKQYREKTGNTFGDKNLVDKPKKYVEMDIDYGYEEEVEKMIQNEIESKLAPSVQDLIKLLFDVDTMKRQMLEFDLDLEKMPLGKIGRKQLQDAMMVLNEIHGLIQSHADPSQFVAASNRFYILIPHGFGVKRPPVLNTVDQLTQKAEMLESLLEMELAYGLLKEETDSKKSSIDGHYDQLKAVIVPLDKSTEEFKILQTYVKRTHAATHAHFELEIEDVFKVSRFGEERRYEPFKKIHNRQLLWHGSRLTNFVGILSHGLKIAPPDAPATGYMFGKGIYFADMVSKSANYCCTSKENSTGLMLLCEVALGNMMELHDQKYVEKLPQGFHSTKGMGRTYPRPERAYVRDDDVTIPFGEPVNDIEMDSALLYNEFIVYDVAQVKVQYLFKMNFKHKQ